MSRSRLRGIALLAVAVALVGVVFHFGHLPQPAQPAGSQASAAASGGDARSDSAEKGDSGEPLIRGGRSAEASVAGLQSADAKRSSHRQGTAALRVLRAWDARRAAAYASASPARLTRLYSPGSRAGSADVRVLVSYRSRGLRVVGMRTQVLALDVLRAGPGRWVLRVEDRLARAVAAGNGRQVVLPRDSASTRTVTLLHSADGRWRVSSVVDG